MLGKSMLISLLAVFSVDVAVAVQDSVEKSCFNLHRLVNAINDSKKIISNTSEGYYYGDTNDFILTYMLSEGHPAAMLYVCSESEQLNRGACRYVSVPVFSNDGNTLQVCDPINNRVYSANAWAAYQKGSKYVTSVVPLGTDEQDIFEIPVDYVDGLKNPVFNNVTGTIPAGSDGFKITTAMVNFSYLNMRKSVVNLTDKNSADVKLQQVFDVYYTAWRKLNTSGIFSYPAETFVARVKILDRIRTVMKQVDELNQELDALPKP